MVAVTAERLKTVPVGDCIQCLGSHTNHTLEVKFAALEKAGFTITEFSFAEYYSWVRNQVSHLPDIDPESLGNAKASFDEEQVWQALYDHGPKIKALAGQHGVKMLSIQCLGQFDGWPANSERETLARKKAEHWLQVCVHLGLEFCQVGVNDNYDAIAGREKTIEDMRWLAERAEVLGIKIAFESWNFAPKNNEWEATYEVVKAVNHPNLGLCIDTAQCALAPAYGFDPTSGNGYTEVPFQALLARLRALPAEKIFFVEISDVLKPSPPLLLGSAFDDWHRAQGPGYRTGFTWCRCARVIPHIGQGTGKLVRGNEGLGAARVAELLRAILETGFQGPMFYECFEAAEQEQPDLSIPEELAQAAKLSWELMSAAILAA